MSAVSRFVARLLIYSIYTIAVALTLTFILSDIPVLRWSGLLLLLFLLDRLLHIGEAEESLLTLRGDEASLSLTHFMTPAAARYSPREIPKMRRSRTADNFKF